MTHTYLLIHGAWQSSWCWTNLIPRLEAAGQRVLAPDLPGHGQSPEPIAAQNMASYAKAIVSVLEAQPEPVLLVGHSMGGMSISQAASDCPDKVEKLVYLAALLPKDGQSVDGADTGLTPTDWAGLAAQGLAADLYDEGKSSLVKPEFIAPALYAGLPPEVVAECVTHHCREALAAQYQPVHLSEAFQALPKYYIGCTEDQIVPPPLQERMLRETPCTAVYHLHSGHAPYLTCPEELTDLLLSIGDLP